MVVMAPMDPTIPATIRNANFLKNGLVWLGLAAIALIANVASAFSAGWVGLVLLVIPAVVATACLALWRTYELAISKHGVRIGRPLKDLVLGWPDILRFEIREPARRTPFMLNFRPWADQARVVLADGTTHRVRAVQPWHGFTALTFFSITGPTAADAVVDTLNHLRDSDALARSADATK